MSENVKTLLVIGNGFDLAHGLKTKYTDFLDYVKVIQTSLAEKQNRRIEHLSEHKINSIPIREYQKKGRMEVEKKQLIAKYQHNKEQLLKDENYLKKCRKKIHSSLKSDKFLRARVIHYIYIFGNVWLNYFQAVQNDKIRLVGENWVDFESEIANIVQKFENFILNWEHLKKDAQIKPDRDMSYFLSNYHNHDPKTLIQKDIPKMAWDLKMLTLALEFYLIEVTDKTIDKSINMIKNLPNVSTIISYNYSNIFGKIYVANPDIDLYFIHGELGKHNLVLGIGETLEKDTQDKFTICASFKKFFQRIKYKLGNEYENLERSYYADYEWQIVIYGHSLDTTDEDSLRWLLVKSHKFQTKVKNILIYYYDEDAYNQQIANAIQIMGKNELINAVNSKRIVFLPMQGSD